MRRCLVVGVVVLVFAGCGGSRTPPARGAEASAAAEAHRRCGVSRTRPAFTRELLHAAWSGRPLSGAERSGLERALRAECPVGWREPMHPHELTRDRGGLPTDGETFLLPFTCRGVEPEGPTCGAVRMDPRAGQWRFFPAGQQVMTGFVLDRHPDGGWQVLSVDGWSRRVPERPVAISADGTRAVLQAPGDEADLYPEPPARPSPYRWDLGQGVALGPVALGSDGPGEHVLRGFALRAAGGLALWMSSGMVRTIGADGEVLGEAHVGTRSGFSYSPTGNALAIHLERTGALVDLDSGEVHALEGGWSSPASPHNSYSTISPTGRWLVWWDSNEVVVWPVPEAGAGRSLYSLDGGVSNVAFVGDDAVALVSWEPEVRQRELRVLSIVDGATLGEAVAVRESSLSRSADGRVAALAGSADGPESDDFVVLDAGGTPSRATGVRRSAREGEPPFLQLEGFEPVPPFGRLYTSDLAVALLPPLLGYPGSALIPASSLRQ